VNKLNVHTFLFIILSIMLIMASGCGDDTVRPDDQQDQTGPINPYGDPPDYSGDPFEDFPTVTGVTIPTGGEEEVYEEEVLSGSHFTVQVSAVTSEADALSLAESIDAQITLPVFVDHEGNYWKVRVGAFPARQDAIDYTSVMMNMGFADAWVTTRQP
jgi:hypothetical protein